MRGSWILGLSVLLVAGSVQAEPARSAKRSVGSPGEPQVVRLTVRGRAARPQVITEIKRAKVRFGVGTARYAYAWPVAATNRSAGR
jgi:hypothetical protein